MIQRRRLPAFGRLTPLLALALIVGLWLAARFHPQTAALAAERGVAGRVVDEQDEPVGEAQVGLYINHEDQPVAQAQTQPDGAYLLVLPGGETVSSARVEVERPHFQTYVWTPNHEELSTLLAEGSFVTHDIILKRHFGASFWITTAIFVGMLALIATERLHNTLAVLLAMAIILTVSLVGGALIPDLFVFTFEQALRHVDFEVIFLLLGMMIVIGVIEETGIFQWLAYGAYRLSRGKVWLLVIVLMSITMLTSSVLDNVITMLLITPITLEIALALGVNPLSLLIPALLSANVGGMSTLVGTPVNIMVGSDVGLGFNDFLTNLTPGVILMEIGLIAYILIAYRKEHRAPGQKPSPTLLQRLEQDSRIRDVAKLRKAGIVFAGLLALFVFGEQIHLTPAVAAIIGAVVMLIWVHPDIEQMMGVVDWTTLIFFIGLFMIVGAVQEVGLLALAADGIHRLVGDNLLAAVLVVVWASTLLSGVVDNIPFTAAMLPVVGFLTRTLPGASSNVLAYALMIGANLGGNSTLIASSPNLVVAGITGRAGYPLTFRKFLSVGLPATLITVVIGCLWLLVHFR